MLSVLQALATLPTFTTHSFRSSSELSLISPTLQMKKLVLIVPGLKDP